MKVCFVFWRSCGRGSAAPAAGYHRQKTLRSRAQASDTDLLLNTQSQSLRRGLAPAIDNTVYTHTWRPDGRAASHCRTAENNNPARSAWLFYDVPPGLSMVELLLARAGQAAQTITSNGRQSIFPCCPARRNNGFRNSDRDSSCYTRPRNQCR